MNGNRAQSNALYQNTGDTFTTGPVWTSGPSNATHSTAVGDVDGDGDLDVVFGNTGERNTLYEIVGGVLSAINVWTPDQADGTGGMDLGDVDGDGDLDLVCANIFSSNTLYLGKKNVLFTGNPDSLTNHVPNTEIFMSGVTTGPSGVNTIK